MTITEKLVLGLMASGFIVFYVVLLAAWIATKGWAPRSASVAVSQAVESEVEAEPMRAAA